MDERMPVIYVAGAYRASGEWSVHENIEYAAHVARALWTVGYAVICPHKNTAFMAGPDLRDQVTLAGDRELLRRCDVLYLLSNWEQSAGAQGEKKLAEQLGIPIVTSMPAALEWIGEFAASHTKRKNTFELAALRVMPARPSPRSEAVPPIALYSDP